LTLVTLILAVTNLTEDKKRLEQEVKALKDIRRELMKNNSMLNSELENTEIQLQEIQEQYQQVNGKVEQLQKRNEQLQKENDALKKQLRMERAKKTSPISSRGVRKSNKSFYMNSTAYTAYCKGCSGKTRWRELDLRANPNLKVIAVDPSIIPLGTKVYVEGYGYAIAADTGGAIHGYKIDIFMPSRQQALQWGRRTVKVTIIN
jgi:3D (Asp-Asp-Asp) domain-containing protein